MNNFIFRFFLYGFLLITRYGAYCLVLLGFMQAIVLRKLPLDLLLNLAWLWFASAIIFGAALAIWSYVRTNSKAYQKDALLNLLPGEEILYGSTAAYVRPKGLGGKLYLTNTRLAFRPFSSKNKLFFSFDVGLDDIVEVESGRTWKWSGSNLSLQLKNGIMVSFNTLEPKVWAAHLGGEKQQNAVLA